MGALAVLFALSAGVAAPATAVCVHRWESCYDLDGDGQADQLEVSFSGGAHCCYTLGAALTTGHHIALPFEMDGGYVFGLDLSQPDRFFIHDSPTGPELAMVIGTYSWDSFPIPAEWRRLGARSHRIAVSFPRGRLHLRND